MRRYCVDWTTLSVLGCVLLELSELLSVQMQNCF